MQWEEESLSVWCVSQRTWIRNSQGNTLRAGVAGARFLQIWKELWTRHIYRIWETSIYKVLNFGGFYCTAPDTAVSLLLFHPIEPSAFSSNFPFMFWSFHKSVTKKRMNGAIGKKEEKLNRPERLAGWLLVKHVSLHKIWILRRRGEKARAELAFSVLIALSWLDPLFEYTCSLACLHDMLLSPEPFPMLFHCWRWAARSGRLTSALTW